MPFFDLTTGLVVYGIAAVLLAAILGRAGAGLVVPTLVLQEWNEEPTAQGDLVVVRGRRAGLISFLLEIVGIDPRIRLILRTNEVELSSTGLLGHSYHRIPIARVAGTVAGFSRPIHWLVLGVLVVAYGAFADSRLGVWKLLIIAMGLFCFGLFVLGKAAFVSVQGFAGAPLAIRYKGSLLNAQTIDIGAAQRFTRLVGDLTLEHSFGLGSPPTGEGSPGSRTRQSTSRAAPEPPPPATAYCGYCGRMGVVGEPCPHCRRTVE